MATQWEYEFDPYGDNPLNKIVDEPHTITPVNGKNFSFFIPKKGPFHRRSVIVKDRLSGARLNIGKDWYVGWRYDDIILGGAVQPVYGAIVMNDPTKSYDLVVTYQTVGGNTTLDDQEIVRLLANTQRDPRRGLWTDIVGVPAELPPVPHRQSTGDLIGFDSQIEVLYKIADAIAEGNVKSMQALMEHVADHHNPHRITLSDLGIDELGNLIIATKEEAESGTENTHYMTSLRVSQFATAKIVPLIDAHKADISNPHKTTAAQVGLGLVQNYSVASTTEAEAGVATNRYMTPSTSVLLMNALFKPLLQSHIDNKSNPHGVTKAQVGLGNVDNFLTATTQEAGQGTATNKFMTPFLTSIAISAQVNVAINYHTEDFNNPHKTTAAQVGLGNVSNFQTATVMEAAEGTAIDKFMTAYLTSQAINVLAPIALEYHTLDKTNPHDVTKTQVGLSNVSNYSMATQGEALLGTATDRYMSPFLTDALIQKKLEEAGVGDNVTKETIGLGRVENLFPATTEEMKTLADRAYVTTDVLKGFFNDNDQAGIKAFIDKSTIGLDKVENLPVATDDDIANHTSTAVMTPEATWKMFSERVVSSPLLTNLDVSSITTKPYSLVRPDSQLGVVATSEGFTTSYLASEAKEGEVYSLTDYAFTGTNAQTLTVKHAPPAAVVTIPVMFLRYRDDVNGYRFGLTLEGSKVCWTMIKAGILTKSTVKQNITPWNINSTFTVTASLNSANGSYTVSLVENGVTHNFSGVMRDILTEFDIGEDPAELILQGITGLSVNADAVNLSTNGVTLSASYLPVPADGYLVNTATGKNYTYSGNTWVESANAVYLKPGLPYWNPMSDELFLAVTTRKAIPYGMASVVE